MNAPKKPREPKHHFVPRFLLRRFAANNKVQLVHRYPVASAGLCDVEKAFQQRGFYTLENVDGKRFDEVETKLLKAVDRRGATAVRRTVDEGRFPPSDLDRQSLSELIAFQLVRTERYRETVLEFNSQLASQTVSQMTYPMAEQFLRAESDNPNPQEIWELVREARAPSGKWGVDDPALCHLQNALGVVCDLAPFLAERSWQLATFDAPLLIGDEPIGVIPESERVGDPAGIKTAGMVVFPVSPFRAFVLLKSGAEELRTAPSELANLINRHVAFGCAKHIAHRPGDRPLQGICLRKPGDTVQVRGPYVVNHCRPVSRPKKERKRWQRRFPRS